MPTLTDTQMKLLATGAERSDGSLLPIHSSVTLNKGSMAASLKSLLRKGLVEEAPRRTEECAWRTDDSRGAIVLVITAAGRAALDSEAPVSADRASRKRQQHKARSAAGTGRSRSSLDLRSSRRSGPASAAGSDAPFAQASTAPHLPKPGSKLALVIDLLRRDDGASLPELVTATGWQAHSVRGVLSGTIKKKLGLPITSVTAADRGRVYRLRDIG